MCRIGDSGCKTYVHNLKTVALESFNQRHSNSRIVFDQQHAHETMVARRPVRAGVALQIVVVREARLRGES